MTGAAARVGVHGMGGIGKSVLANMLARDTEVRRAFPDGIFWVPLGVMKAQEAESKLMQLQRNVAGAFADNVYLDNVAQGRAKLGELLAGKAVLLILDDVWERAHAEAFDVLAARCRAVITTRDAGLVTSLGGAQHQVQLFTQIESLNLLAGATGVNPGDLPPEAREIVHECGFLPLAVALCAGMVKRGVAWAGILARLKQAALESIADRNAANAQHLNLWTAMKVSVDSLTPDEQQRYVELAVFPNDKTVAEAAVRTLWQHTGKLDEFACEDLLLSLSERSLIWLNTDSPLPGQAPRRSVSLHALLYDFIFKLAGDMLAKLKATDVIELMADYDTVQMLFPSYVEGKDKALRLVQGALRLSAHVLAQDKMQLPSQMTGRLLSFEHPEIMALLEHMRKWKGGRGCDR